MRNNDFGSAQGPTQIISVRCYSAALAITTETRKHDARNPKSLVSNYFLMLVLDNRHMSREHLPYIECSSFLSC